MFVNPTSSGFVQDNKHFSCAYDVVFTILRRLWVDRQSIWTKSFNKLNPLMRMFNSSLLRHKRGEIPLAAVCNKVCHLLHTLDANQFPYGLVGCHINNLALYLTTSTTDRQMTVTSCIGCGNMIEDSQFATYFVDCMSGASQPTAAFVDEHFNSVVPGGCLHCKADITRQLVYDETPDWLAVALSTFGVGVSASVSVRHKRRNRLLRIRGVIYFCDFHFTARVVDLDGQVMFYDGRESGGVPSFDGNLSNFGNDSWTDRMGAAAVMVIYSK